MEADEESTPLVKLPDNGIDDALEKSFGRCGYFQISMQCISMLFVIAISHEIMVTYFVGSNPPWKYVDTTRYGNDSYDVNHPNFKKRCNLTQDEWIYTLPKSNSFVTEYDLVCDRESLAALTDGAYFLGASMGPLLCGTASDNYGRKRVLIIGIILNFCFSVLSCFVNEIWQLILLRLLVGASNTSCFGLCFIILSEFMPLRLRSLSSNVYQFGAGISKMVLTLVAYYARSWRKILLILSFPCLIGLLIYPFIPKSPRWLLAVGKVDDAKKVLKTIGDFNREPLQEIALERSSVNKFYTYIDLFAQRKMIILTLVQSLLWMTIGLIYYTIVLQAFFLGGDVYGSFALISFADFPGNLVTAYACGRFGRKRTVLVCIFVSSLFTGFISTVPSYYNFAYITKTTLAMLGKFFIHCAFNGVYLWTFELFPTVVRTQGWIVCNAFSRGGGVIAPFLSNNLQSLNPRLPYVVIGICGVLASSVGHLLPETNNLKTRETLEDIYIK